MKKYFDYFKAYLKNKSYDRNTNLIMKRLLKVDSNCIDVGCHKGSFLDSMLKFAPNGMHFAFEPLPHLFEKLQVKYSNSVNLFSDALSDSVGTTTFNYVKNAPAYSGIKKRSYDLKTPEIDKITVNLNTLDNIIPENTKIDFIKIDVEGAEFSVLKGAKNLLLKYKPTVIFECGLGASDYYGTTPKAIFEFLNKEVGLKISKIDAFVKNEGALNLEAFENCFNNATEFYYIAHV